MVLLLTDGDTHAHSVLEDDQKIPAWCPSLLCQTVEVNHVPKVLVVEGITVGRVKLFDIKHIVRILVDVRYVVSSTRTDDAALDLSLLFLYVAQMLIDILEKIRKGLVCDVPGKHVVLEEHDVV